MTSPDLPVGACGDAAPTGDPLNAVAYARGVLEEEAKEARRICDELRRTVEVLLAALDGGEAWEIDNARNLAARELNHLKDRP